MKLFVFKNPYIQNGVAVASIFDDKAMDAYKTIDPDGFFIETSELPEGAKDWFECMEFTADKKIHICLEKAKEQTRNRLRAERQPLLEKLDIEYVRAQEMGYSTKEIVREKNRLRDITKLCNTCCSLEELKKISVK